MKKKTLQSLLIGSVTIFGVTLFSLNTKINAYAEQSVLMGLISDTTQAISENLMTKPNDYSIYYGQLHSHSDYSDGKGTAVEAYEHAKNKAKQLDFFALTDHSHKFDHHKEGNIKNGDSSSEWVQTKKLAKKYTSKNFIALCGYEMTFNNGLGHINTFNTQGFESRNLSIYSDYETGLQTYYNKLVTVPKSLSQFNHPSEKWGHFREFAFYSTSYDSVITNVEMPGFHKVADSGNYCDYYNLVLDKGWHVAPVNNQDNHDKNWGTVNDKRSVILAKKLSEDSIYDAMRNNRCYSTEDYDFQLKYTLNGYIMGSKVNISRIGENVNLSIDLKDPSDSKIGKVEVIVNYNNVLHTEYISSNSKVLNLTFPANYSYYYIRITQDDKDMIVSAPVWIGYYKTREGFTKPTYAPSPTPTPTPTATPTTSDAPVIISGAPTSTITPTTAEAIITSAPIETTSAPTEAPADTDTPSPSATDADTPKPSSTNTDTATPAPTDADTVKPTEVTPEETEKPALNPSDDTSHDDGSEVVVEDDDALAEDAVVSQIDFEGQRKDLDELDDVPATGDYSMFTGFYILLALSAALALTSTILLVKNKTIKH
ncbi:MAG: hypothetical protein E7262_04775 [Lachnospiraceae bacterium]|nr:hypothetical protein [Lachnospiraceae bacterium]